MEIRLEVKAAWKAVENTFPILREDVNSHFCIFEQGHDPDSDLNQHGSESLSKTP